jgi:5-methylcytosine-specific restriction endonuclease McrA
VVVDELLAAATHRTKRDIELLLVERFPKADVQAQVRAIPPAPPQPLALESNPLVERPSQPQLIANTASEPAPAQVGDPVISCHIQSPRPAEYARVAPLSPQRYGIQFTLDQAGHDLLRQVQDLLGHEVPRSDLAEVIVRALKAYAALLEKKKHSATEDPRPSRRRKPGSRHIPARVKRIVRKRDEGQCTHVSKSGHRCEARSDLEYDHILEYARGGEATVGNIRLRCRAHNRLGADRTYGARFMERKQAEAVQRRASPHGSPGARVEQAASQARA